MASADQPLTSNMLAALAAAASATRPIHAPYGAVDALIDDLRARNVPIKLPHDPEWSTLVKPYNSRLEYVPCVFVIPNFVQHISDAVTCASDRGIKVQARSGGHSYASYSLGGANGHMVIDLQKFTSVNVDDSGIAQIGGGARLGPIAQQLYKKHGRAFAHGTCPEVGIGGHATHGGFGYASRSWGLALDQVVRMDVVMASGKYVLCTQIKYPEVFYAMRGAADSIGIAVYFYIKTHPAPERVINFEFDFKTLLEVVPNAVATVRHLQNFVHDEVNMDRHLTFSIQLYGGLTLRITGVYMGSYARFVDEIMPRMVNDLPVLPNSRMVNEVNWLKSLELLSGGNSLDVRPLGQKNRDNFFAKSVTIPDQLSEESLTNYFRYVHQEGPKAPTFWWASISLYGGVDSQINKQDERFSAYAYRKSLWVAQHYASVPVEDEFPREGLEFIEGLNKALTRNMPRFGAYINYVDPTLTPEEAHKLYYGQGTVWREQYYGRASDRHYLWLVNIKERLDPKNVFANPQSIGKGLE